MREVDQNNAIEPISDQVRAAACQYEAAAVAGEGKRGRLYFPVNSDDEAVRRAAERPPGGDVPKRGRLYFPVNSRNETGGLSKPSAARNGGVRLKLLQCTNSRRSAHKACIS